MATEVDRGEIWLYRFAPPDKRRPVLVLSRPSLLSALHTATVAAVTTTLHGSPVEVRLGPNEGLKRTCCANLANLYTVRQSDLRKYVGTVGPTKMQQVCRSLAIATGCD